jgi:hypothetical protein
VQKEASAILTDHQRYSASLEELAVRKVLIEALQGEVTFTAEEKRILLEDDSDSEEEDGGTS